MKRGMRVVTVRVGVSPIKTKVVSLAVTVSHVLYTMLYAFNGLFPAGAGIKNRAG